jgi:hypothetical protein
MIAALAWCVVVLLIGGAQLPKEPDFSGEWVLVKASGATADQAASLSVRQTITRTTVRGEPMTPFYSTITVARYFKGRIHGESHRFWIGVVGGTMPGIPRGASSPTGEWTGEKVEWRDDKLVIRTTASFQPMDQPGPWTEHQEVWSLDGNGRLLITTNDRGSNITPTTVRLVYQRRQASGPLTPTGGVVAVQEIAEFLRWAGRSDISIVERGRRALEVFPKGWRIEGYPASVGDPTSKNSVIALRMVSRQLERDRVKVDEAEAVTLFSGDDGIITRDVILVVNRTGKTIVGVYQAWHGR